MQNVVRTKVDENVLSLIEKKLRGVSRIDLNDNGLSSDE